MHLPTIFHLEFSGVFAGSFIAGLLSDKSSVMNIDGVLLVSYWYEMTYNELAVLKEGSLLGNSQ